MPNIIPASDIVRTATDLAGRIKQLVQDNQPVPPMSDLLGGMAQPPQVSSVPAPTPPPVGK